MDIGTSLLPTGTPRDQPYICPHCQATFISFRMPYNGFQVRPPVHQRLTVDAARLTCGKYPCWEQEVNAHSEERIAFFKRFKKSSTPPPGPTPDSVDDF